MTSEVWAICAGKSYEEQSASLNGCLLSEKVRCLNGYVQDVSYFIIFRYCLILFNTIILPNILFIFLHYIQLRFKVKN